YLLRSTAPGQQNLVSEEDIQINPQAIALVSKELATKAYSIPIDIDEKNKILTMGVVDSRDITVLDEIQFTTGFQVKTIEVSQAFVEEQWKLYYAWTGALRVSRQSDLLQSD